MMKIRLLLMSLVFLCPVLLPAQDETPEELFEDAEFFFLRGDYEEAAYLYQQLLKKEPEHDRARYLLGRAFLNVPGQEYKAIPYLEQASLHVADHAPRFKRDRYQDKIAPHHTWFYLGQAYRINNRLQEALEAFEKFRSLKNFEKKYNPRVTEEEIDAVERAKIIQDAPVNLQSAIFQEPINTTGSDYDAVISASENMLVWMNSQKFYEAVMMSRKIDGKWSAPVNITPQLGSDGNMRPTGLSFDGKTLLLVVEGQFDSDIYTSSFDGTFWSKAVPLKGDINSNFTEAHASFFPSGDRILVATDRRGSLGGLDIFVSSIRADGSWSVPEHLGTNVNTPQDETSAFISPDSSRIFFASKGHFNMGDFDIFYCDLDDQLIPGEAINMGYPVNTTTANTYYVPTGDGFSGIYCRFDQDGIGQEDIWEIDILPETEDAANTISRISSEDFSLTITDRESGEEIRIEYDAIRDAFDIQSSGEKEYKIVYSRDDH